MKDTIKSNDDIERLFRTGRRSSSYIATVLVAPSAAGSERGRCAFIAGKKLGTAPLRSRCKRVLRAAAAELGAPWNGYDVVFTARRKVAEAPHGDVVRKLRKQLEELGVVEDCPKGSCGSGKSDESGSGGARVTRRRASRVESAGTA